MARSKPNRYCRGGQRNYSFMEVSLRAVPDGQGGAYVIWQTQLPTQEAMQLINHDGTVVWNEPLVFDPSAYGYYVEIVPDGQGNVILGWTSPNPAADVYCQKD
ncbi:MAG: hypothetical protein IPP40_12030 [bacterium]|nr:hypothetical protein [bacterium]